jgi:hypothetical protein
MPQQVQAINAAPGVHRRHPMQQCLIEGSIPCPTGPLIPNPRPVRAGRESRAFFLFSFLPGCLTVLGMVMTFVTLTRCNMCRGRVHASALPFPWSQPHHSKHPKAATSKSLSLSTGTYPHSGREPFFLTLSGTAIRRRYVTLPPLT